MAERTFTIQAFQPEDIPAAAQLSRDAFEVDRHTEMKSHAEKPYDMKEVSLEILPGYMKSPRCVLLKAVDNATGQLVGFCTWGFRGFNADEMPIVEGRVQPPGDTNPKPAATSSEASKEPEAAPKETEEKDPVKRLTALTDADLKAWMEDSMPPGTRCIYVVGLSVAPSFQGRGVGKALLGWGTSLCDKEGVFAWVHSSEPAWGMYEKSGFQTIRVLDIDLDEYAPCPPPNEGPDAKWGHYVFRYMKYLPKDL